MFRYILPRTIIMSDGWRAYGAIDQLNAGIYEHRVVIHEENFIDPNVHTQNIENLWMRVKRDLKYQFGTSQDLFPSYLHAFIWANKFKHSDLFAEFIIELARQYNV